MVGSTARHLRTVRYCVPLTVNSTNTTSSLGRVINDVDPSIRRPRVGLGDYGSTGLEADLVGRAVVRVIGRDDLGDGIDIM